jgi:hypothetical protein
MKKTIELILLIILGNSIGSACAADLSIAYNPSWPTIGDLFEKQSKSQRGKFFFNPVEADSMIVSKLVNLQVDVAILPIDQFQLVYDYRTSLSKFVVRAIVGQESVGIISKKNCQSTPHKIWIDPKSTEYNWYKINIQNKNEIKVESNMYAMLFHVDFENWDCSETILASGRYLKKLKNHESYKFEKLGNVPFVLLVEDHFMRSRKAEISELISLLKSGNDIQKQIDIKGEVVKYNFQDRKDEWKKLDDYIKYE